MMQPAWLDVKALGDGNLLQRAPTGDHGRPNREEGAALEAPPGGPAGQRARKRWPLAVLMAGAARPAA